jgi:4'-phosphopantetheinyl transferase
MRVVPPGEFAEPATLLDQRHAIEATLDRVDLWAFSLDCTAATLAHCQSLLSEDECTRARRFVHERDRARFVAAHGVVRHVLGRYVGAPAHSLRFSFCDTGKPELVGAGVSFNLSHADSRALFAVSIGCAVGVDLERGRPEIDVLGIAGRFFYRNEYAAIRAAADSERADLFLRYWVAKEAVLKAEGVGIGIGLDRFTVQFQSDQLSACIDTPTGAPPLADWRIHLPACEPGWHAAVAARGADWRVRWIAA